MEGIKQSSKALWDGRVLLIVILGLLCILYLVTTRTTGDQRLIDVLKKHCYAHYALITRPTLKNEYRFLRYQEKLARLSGGKFHHLNAEEVRDFLIPRGYAYEMEEGDGKVDYLLGSFFEEGSFEGSGSHSISYHYFLLNRIFVFPYEHYRYDASRRKRDLSPLIFYTKNGRVYLNGGWIRRRFTELFTCLWESKVTRVSDIKGPKWCKIFYRGLEEIWKETRLYHRSWKAARKHFVRRSLESSMPTMLACISREYFYRHKDLGIEKKLELSYLRSLMEDHSFITLGLLCYLDEVGHKSWARKVITGLGAEGLGELGSENCSLEHISWAAGKAFRTESGDFV